MATGSAGESAHTVRDGGGVFDELPAGTSVLLSGPPLIGKDEVMLETLAAGNGAGEGSVVISARDDEHTVLDDYERVYPGFDPSLVGVVECISDRNDDGTRVGDARVRRAGSPADLTGIGIGASELMNELHEGGATGIRVGVDSLSTLLLYSEFDRLARFLHVMSGRIDRAEGIGVFAINPGTIEEAQFDQLKSLFDGMVELRERDDTREIRVRGIGGVHSEWRPYHPPEFD